MVTCWDNVYANEAGVTALVESVPAFAVALSANNTTPFKVVVASTAAILISLSVPSPLTDKPLLAIISIAPFKTVPLTINVETPKSDN